MQKNKTAGLIFLLLCCHVFAQSVAEGDIISVNTDYLPKMESLRPRIPVPDEKKSMQNYVLSDFNADVEDASKKTAAGQNVLPTFYRYTATKEDTVMSVAARLNISQETLATANHIASADTVLHGKELFLPTVSGLFIPEHPKSALDILLKKEFAPLINNTLPRYSLKGQLYYFLSGKKLTPTQRLFFLDTSMKMPLADIILTSDFGYRTSPITKEWKFHSGVDLAAPIGTSVFACKNGIVQTAKQGDRIFGNYIQKI